MATNVSARSPVFMRHGGLTLLAIFLAASGTPAPVFCQENQIQTVASKTSDGKKPAIDEQHPLYKPLEVAEKCKKAIDSVEDYECVFVKKELVGKKMIKSTMKMKLREKPFSVYLKFLDLNAGREVLYVQGQNSNELLVHEAGIKSILGTFQLSPASADALSENRHPITQIGLKNMVDTLIKQWEMEGKFGGISTKIRSEKLSSGEACTVYEVIHSKPYKEFKFHTTRMYVDDQTGLAIGMQQSAFPGKVDAEPPVVEEYFYTKLKTNLKMADADFDKNNSSYSFK